MCRFRSRRILAVVNAPIASEAARRFHALKTGQIEVANRRSMPAVGSLAANRPMHPAVLGRRSTAPNGLKKLRM
jgi:hypothetical protein